MTDDDLFFAAVSEHFGRPMSSAEAPDTRGFVSAAVISKMTLVLATVQYPAHARCRFDVERSRIFELNDRSSCAINGLVSDVMRFTQDRQIAQVFLRSLQARGKYPSNPLSFKVEAALQMVPGLRVTFVNSQSIDAWLRREDPAVPEGEGGLGALPTAKQRKAIETALFTARNFDNPKCFSDGGLNDE